MRAVWRAARAAVRRRRLQTIVIGLVTLVSTAAIVVALGLVDSASSPFERTFGKQRGPHVVAVFDPAKVSDGQLARAARRPGVEAAAGPFAQATVDIPRPGQHGLGGPVTFVGRPGPGGPVDRVDLWAGRWATRPGEVVLNRQTDWTAHDLGKRIRLPSGPTLTIVGFAFELSRAADAWVAPDQIAALHPTAAQMLFRFTDASSDARLRAQLATVVQGLPKGALTASESYLTLKHRTAGPARFYAAYLLAFGILGITVAVLIVANVVSGAVISGFRHIGILKALGFTPGQVVAVYLTMISLPAVVGCVLGTAVGNLASRPFFWFVFTGPDSGVLRDYAGVPPWVNALALLGMPVVCALAALLPAVRAHRLSAARAISAGSAPRAGRALGVQRRLAGSRLPRSVSLGVGLPFARPGRSALTLAAVLLGVTTVTFATGLATTMTRFATAGQDAYQVSVYASDVRHSDRELESLLRSLPGAREVTAASLIDVHMAGSAGNVMFGARRGDRPQLNSVLTKGRWTRGTGEVTASSAFLRQHGLRIGDHLTLEKGDRREVVVVVVGEVMEQNNRLVIGDWSTMMALFPQEVPFEYHIKLRDGADADAYARAVRAAEPGADLELTSPDPAAQAINGSAAALTLMLTVVAALGVFNTVVLNTRDRRRDLGMLKSIGMTPRQVTAMMVTSMAVLGAAGSLLGIPLGIAGYDLVVPRMTDAVDIALPSYMTDVWHPPALVGLALAGLVIGVLGALIPARRAARLTIAEVLHNE
ncbi:FtsX-like permease family protein [Streptomyces sp. NBS 14/10]|uniref:ABC transporter permease n=1 Tax=Streptomyces sp. NBS 14/10 TaxID=1945643 RepID=UPI000B7D26DA|nr:FtsX-like permease family protein [Streptomyces sp. NBS 14/10]KAK1177414.1 FtsX-like permease family protein [Streptomyces sp. NBS 14/10]